MSHTAQPKAQDGTNEAPVIPPHVACEEARKAYESCVSSSFRSFFHSGMDTLSAGSDCEAAADVLRVCIADAQERVREHAKLQRAQSGNTPS